MTFCLTKKLASQENRICGMAEGASISFGRITYNELAFLVCGAALFSSRLPFRTSRRFVRHPDDIAISGRQPCFRPNRYFEVLFVVCFGYSRRFCFLQAPKKMADAFPAIQMLSSFWEGRLSWWPKRNSSGLKKLSVRCGFYFPKKCFWLMRNRLVSSTAPTATALWAG